jgi:hypothetical protein
MMVASEADERTVTARAALVAKSSVPRQILEVRADYVSSACTASHDPAHLPRLGLLRRVLTI